MLQSWGRSDMNSFFLSRENTLCLCSSSTGIKMSEMSLFSCTSSSWILLRRNVFFLPQSAVQTLEEFSSDLVTTWLEQAKTILSSLSSEEAWSIFQGHSRTQALPAVARMLPGTCFLILLTESWIALWLWAMLFIKADETTRDQLACCGIDLLPSCMGLCPIHHLPEPKSTQALTVLTSFD